jgi:hypothetical protein
VVRLGLADVLVTRLWALLAALYGVDIILTQPEPGATWAGLGLIVAATLVQTFGTAPLAVAAFVALLGPATSTETAFVMWGSAALALFDGDQLRLALRYQVVIVYLFAAANKLWPTFLSGSILAAYMPWFPAPGLLAPVAVATEVFLGIAVLRRWWIALPGIVGFHSVIAFTVATDPRHTASLLIYGAMMLWSVAVANGVRLRPRHANEPRYLSTRSA